MLGFCSVQPLFALIFSRLLRQPIWWRFIHLFFVPAVFLLYELNMPAWLYMSAFFLLLLIFWGTAKGDVPLFLSGSAASEVLADIIEREHADSLIDLGAGIGSVVIPVAKRFPGLDVVAVERAPIPYLILRWRCRFMHNIKVQRDNFWNCDLSGYDVVYAFLSPSVMERLGEKCRQEMNKGEGVLVSSCFPLPNFQGSIIGSTNTDVLIFYCYRFGKIPGNIAIGEGVAESEGKRKDCPRRLLR